MNSPEDYLIIKKIDWLIKKNMLILTNLLQSQTQKLPKFGKIW